MDKEEFLTNCIILLILLCPYFSTNDYSFIRPVLPQNLREMYSSEKLVKGNNKMFHEL